MIFKACVAENVVIFVVLLEWTWDFFINAYLVPNTTNAVFPQMIVTSLRTWKNFFIMDQFFALLAFQKMKMNFGKKMAIFSPDLIARRFFCNNSIDLLGTCQQCSIILLLLIHICVLVLVLNFHPNKINR